MYPAGTADDRPPPSIPAEAPTSSATPAPTIPTLAEISTTAPPAPVAPPQSDDVVFVLLRDIRSVWPDTMATLSAGVLIDRLIHFNPERWSASETHKDLSPQSLGQLLSRGPRIRSTPLLTAHRTKEVGYLRTDFEPFWTAYLDAETSPGHRPPVSSAWSHPGPTSGEA